ncbi:hypothetical protein [Sulfitobacter sp. 1A15299]|uniref:hypothetical protein n=1 Tax=Sulfitobacter sp. 1A15299 TaxID=3368598 RepID=UPI0037453D97
MFDFVFAVIAISLGGPSGPSDGVGRLDAPMTVQAPPRPAAPARPVAPPAPAAPPPAFYMGAVPPGLIAEDQTPTGRFTTAAEVRPILNATRGNWIALRQYDGRDFLYVTHLWSWRCGLSAMAIAVNDASMRNLPMPPCHDSLPTPNAILEGDPQPYLTFDLGSVQRVRVQLVYDDLEMALEGFLRSEVLLP